MTSSRLSCNLFLLHFFPKFVNKQTWVRTFRSWSQPKLLILAFKAVHNLASFFQIPKVFLFLSHCVNLQSFSLGFFLITPYMNLANSYLGTLSCLPFPGIFFYIPSSLPIEGSRIHQDPLLRYSQNFRMLIYLFHSWQSLVYLSCSIYYVLNVADSHSVIKCLVSTSCHTLFLDVRNRPGNKILTLEGFIC